MKRTTAIVLALLVVAFFVARHVLFEKTVEDEVRGFTGEAATNPFFALRELYRELGVEAETPAGLETLPPHDHALLLQLENRPLFDDEIERLVAWIEDGGHLVVSLGSLGGRSVVEDFDHPVSLRQYFPPPSQAEEPGDPESDEEPEILSTFDTARSQFPRLLFHESQPVRIDGTDEAAWIASFEHGHGHLTVVVDLDAFRNGMLGEKEHAELAWWLVASSPVATGDGPGGVWIVSRDRATPAGSLLFSRARPAVIALAALCLVLVLRFARPLGPTLEAPPGDRRHLAEHLRATGRFYWSREVEHVLLAAVQAATRRHLAHGGDPDLDELVKLARQAARHGSGTPPGEAALRHALTLPSTRSAQRFTETIRVLEALRRTP